jgi:hypothetical protein
MTVKNFSPELLNIFKVGSQKDFQFDCGSEKAAQALRARLHNLRREMRKERHWLTSVAEGVVISIPRDKPTFIIAHPPDNDITPDLRKALLAHGVDEIDRAFEEEDARIAEEKRFPIAAEMRRKAKPSNREKPDITQKAESAIHDYLKDYRKPKEEKE